MPSRSACAFHSWIDVENGTSTRARWIAACDGVASVCSIHVLPKADFVVLNPYASFDTARRIRLMGRRDCDPLKQLWEVLAQVARIKAAAPTVPVQGCV